LVVVVSAVLAAAARAQEAKAIVIVRNAPAHGIAMAKVDLSQILKRLGAKPFSPASLQAQLPTVANFQSNSCQRAKTNPLKAGCF
jgi:hypothetical protein